MALKRSIAGRMIGRSVGRFVRLLQLIRYIGAVSVWHYLLEHPRSLGCTASSTLVKRVPGRLLAVARLHSFRQGNCTPDASRRGRHPLTASTPAD